VEAIIKGPKDRINKDDIILSLEYDFIVREQSERYRKRKGAKI
jgi:hypothetical protein